MKIVIASDSFKETLSSKEVNDVLEKTLFKIFPKTQVTKVLIADGGEGTVETILSQKQGKIIYSRVRGPRIEMKVKAKWGIFNDNEDAVIESAQTIGLSLLSKEKRNPKLTTSFGVGELIRQAMNQNVKNIYIGLGGSSTNDGGAGLAMALGVKLLDKHNKAIGYGGAELLKLKKIDITGVDKRIFNTRIICLCDVENKICGKQGASYIFGPQKGAPKNDVLTLDKALKNYATIIINNLGVDVFSLKGGGAAGGIGAGLFAFFNAELKNGIKTILDLIDFKNIINDVDLIITGEGKIDAQTCYGKAVKGISDIAKENGIPVIAFTGSIEGNKEEIKNKLGLKEIFSIVGNGVSKKESLENPRKYLFNTAIDGLKTSLWKSSVSILSSIL
jgi:glycerate kinase